MPRISIAQRHSLGAAEARQRLGVLMERFADRYRFEAAWLNERRATVCGRGIAGKIEVDAREVRFDLQISFVLLPFRSRIEEGIAHRVATALVATGDS